MTWTPFEREKWGLSIGGILVTSAYQIVDFESEMDWQIAKPKGTTGSRSKFLGRRDRTFTINTILTTKEEFAVWMSIITGALKPPDKGKQYVVAIDHPMLAEHYGITFVRLKREVAPVQDPGGLRRWTASLRLEESAPPTVTSVAVKGSAPQVKDPAQNSPRAAELEAQREKNAGKKAELATADAQLNQQLYGNDADSLAK